MDKIMWLKVIREELGILDKLAAGMIEDSNLTREEVELAITRSKIVVNEFEVLYKQLPKTASPPESDQVSAPADSEITLVDKPAEETPVEDKLSTNTAMAEPAEVNSVPLQFVEPRFVTPEIADTVTEIDSSAVSSLQEPDDQNVLNLEHHKEYQPQFKAAPLKSLREGLSLNDRYLFQRELFDNDKSRLDEAVEALDSLSNISEAVTYLKANFKWNKGEASEKFVHLVKRRFS